MTIRFSILALLGLAAAAEAQTIGSITAGPMVGVQSSGAVREAVFGGIASFGFETGRWFLGPEFGFVQGSETRTRILGLAARYTGSGERLRPFVVGGAGSYGWSGRYRYQLPNGQEAEDWSGVDYLSGSLGIGVELGRRGGLTSRIEVRYHGSLQRDGINDGGRGLLSLGAGLRYSW